MFYFIYRKKFRDGIDYYELQQIMIFLVFSDELEQILFYELYENTFSSSFII